MINFLVLIAVQLRVILLNFVLIQRPLLIQKTQVVLLPFPPLFFVVLALLDPQVQEFLPLLLLQIQIILHLHQPLIVLMFFALLHIVNVLFDSEHFVQGDLQLRKLIYNVIVIILHFSLAHLTSGTSAFLGRISSEIRPNSLCLRICVQFVGGSCGLPFSEMEAGGSPNGLLERLL